MCIRTALIQRDCKKNIFLYIVYVVFTTVKTVVEEER